MEGGGGKRRWSLSVSIGVHIYPWIPLYRPTQRPEEGSMFPIIERMKDRCQAPRTRANDNSLYDIILLGRPEFGRGGLPWKPSVGSQRTGFVSLTHLSAHGVVGIAMAITELQPLRAAKRRYTLPPGLSLLRGYAGKPSNTFDLARDGDRIRRRNRKRDRLHCPGRASGPSGMRGSSACTVRRPHHQDPPIRSLFMASDAYDLRVDCYNPHSHGVNANYSPPPS